MIRFAFNPNDSSRKLLATIPGSTPAQLFSTVSTKMSQPDYDSFLYEQQVKELLQVLDGSKSDDQLLGILDNDAIKSGKLARHIVIVLPYCASCDALEKLIRYNKTLFKNLAEYELLNISGRNKKLHSSDEVKKAIANAQANGRMTITLTVNKMLTGTTVKEWDTMIYLKGTASPQEYDQAIFRLQSPWIEDYQDNRGNTIKYDMKPQTLLLDLDPTRLFYLQELKAFTYGANTHKIGNENIESNIQRELRISPIIAMNVANNKLVEVTAANIMDAIRKYSSERTITDDVGDIGIDLSLRDIPEVYDVIGRLSELGGRKGINIKPVEGDDGDDIDTPTGDDPLEDEEPQTSGTRSQKAEGSDVVDTMFEKQFRTYYVMILLFAFLSTTEEKSLYDVIQSIDANEENRRIARHLGLEKADLELIRDNMNWSVLTTLDYKIQNSDYRANDDTITPEQHVEIAINKFRRLSDSEVFTPSNIVDDMYDAFDEKFWHGLRDGRVLDIASKSGNFARGLVLQAAQRGLDVETIRDTFYSIPTSPAAYEFTRKMYDALGLNVDNIALHFTSYDLLGLDEKQLSNLLSNKKLCDLTKDDLMRHATMKGDEREEAVKFTAVVGNPPYQNSAQMQIYTDFYLTSRLLGDAVAMIFPVGWQEPKTGNKFKKLNKKEIKEDPQIVFIDNRQDVFPGIAGAEWTNIIVWKRDHDNRLNGSQKIYTNSKDPQIKMLLTQKSEVEKPEAIKQLAAIVQSHPGFQSTQTMMTDRKPYGLSSDFLNDPEKYDLPPVFDERKHSTDLKIFGLKKRKQVIKYLPSDYPIPKKSKAFNKYKVFVGEAWGNWSQKAGLGGAYADIIIARPTDICTETFTEPGRFDDVQTAQKHAKYLMTKFTRALLYVNKFSLHSRSAWGAVPVQDYTESWWSESIDNLDEHLMDKYNVPEDVRSFVRNNIQHKTEKNILYFDE